MKITSFACLVSFALILQKIFIMCNNNSVNKAEDRAQMAQALFIIKILIGKVLEAWNLITKAYDQNKTHKNNTNSNILNNATYFNSVIC